MPTFEPWGLIFDVDGVIANTEPLAMKATQAAFREYNGADVPYEDMLALMGSTAPAYFAALAQTHAPNAPIEALIERHDELLIHDLLENRSLILPGVRELLNAASSLLECHIGLATSSGRRRSEATLGACGIDAACVRAWVTGDDIRHSKPHPEIYLMTAAALELGPSRCVAIEDSIAGVASAQAAGLKCVAVTNTFAASALNQADVVVSSLEDLSPAMLHGLL